MKLNSSHVSIIIVTLYIEFDHIYEFIIKYSLNM